MKVAFFTKSLALGGGPRAIFYLCKAMPGTEFLICAMPGAMEGEFHTLPNVTVRRVPRWTIRTAYDAEAQCAGEGVDLLHFHSMVPAVYGGFASQIPKIVTFHGLHIRKYDFLRDPLRRAFRKQAVRWVCRRFDSLITLTGRDRDYMAALFDDPVITEKLRVIPNAIELPSADISPKAWAEEAPLRLLVVARQDFPKGLDLLLDMARKIPGERRRFVIGFIGDPGTKALVEEARQNGLLEALWLGETLEPYPYMKSADYLLLPSRWEGLPMVALEALSLGTKVLAADTASVNDWADGKNVFLYRQGDPEDFLRLTEMCAARKGDPCDMDLTEFSLEAVGTKMEKLYRELLR